VELRDFVTVVNLLHLCNVPGERWHRSPPFPAGTFEGDVGLEGNLQCENVDPGVIFDNVVDDGVRFRRAATAWLGALGAIKVSDYTITGLTPTGPRLAAGRMVQIGAVEG
jgi:hypothetical protein